MLIQISVDAQIKQKAERVSPINAQTYPFAVTRPISLSDAKVTGGYLYSYYKRIRDTSVLDLYAKFKKIGYLRNFEIVAKKLNEKHVSKSNDDEWVYKALESAGYFAPESPLIRDSFQPLINDILAAQDSDGYLNTYYQNPLIIQSVGADNRFKSNNRFEFYDFGHLTQAAIAWKQTTGNDELLKASIKFADLICNKFENRSLPYRSQANKPHLVYEHPNHEMAMVDLYRITGNKRYLNFAAHTLDDYKFWSFPEVSGHCVQENLLLCGGADVYLETGNPGQLKHLEEMWTDIIEHKMYITGGVGNGISGETFGKAYILPNIRNYCETCAAVSKVFFDQRLLLATGKTKYADDMERTFYNAVLSGVSLSGTEYFYTNLMEEEKGKSLKLPSDALLVGNSGRTGIRQPLFLTPCCPPNVHRLIGSIQQYMFTLGKDAVQTQLYGNASLKTKLSNGQVVNLTETTDYPREGLIQFVVNESAKFSLALRIPQWTAGTKVAITINGNPVSNIVPGTYVNLNRQWKKGDKILLNFDMSAHLIKGRDMVAAEKNKLAIMRGPLLYCLESKDNSKANIFNVALPANAKFVEDKTADLNGTIRLLTEAVDSENRNKLTIKAIPYHLWANRGESDLRVWIPEAK
ncbi:glycoside hydrolase family 127 protein [Pelobium sp.]|nr:beta-L-arabinofuranosidase domain-containing protein [Pelobium sp.]MDA9554622.1 glycoside hydrolase family 127 protein [Pelobium sp.]